MSRTDKDAPFWVRAEWYEPFHNCGWVRRPKYVETDKPLSWDTTRFEKKFVGYKYVYVGDCDLPAEPVIENTDWKNRKNLKTRCVWEAEWSRENYYQTRGVRCKKYWRHSEFYGPQRMNEKLAAREIVKGNHEAEFPDGRGRHSVLWDMW